MYFGEGAGRTVIGPGCTAAGGVTALRMAAQLGQADSVAQLLAAGADTGWREERDLAGLTALDVALSEDIFGLVMVHGLGAKLTRSPTIDAGRPARTPAGLGKHGAAVGRWPTRLRVGADSRSQPAPTPTRQAARRPAA